MKTHHWYWLIAAVVVVYVIWYKYTKGTYPLVGAMGAAVVPSSTAASSGVAGY